MAKKEVCIVKKEVCIFKKEVCMVKKEVCMVKKEVCMVKAYGSQHGGSYLREYQEYYEYEERPQIGRKPWFFFVFNKSRWDFLGIFN